MSRTGTIIVEGEAYDGGQPGFDTHRQSSIGRSSIESFEVPTPYTGAETPRPLLGPGHVLAEERDLTEISRELERIASHRSATPHMGDVMQTLARTSMLPVCFERGHTADTEKSLASRTIFVEHQVNVLGLATLAATRHGQI